ncbi:C4-dicarboxylate transporter DcuC [Pelosinus fermentans]|uniref:Anaerobic c4-dicarboxylate antiporter, DcuC family n=1 Tax=Pelosinus fermentans JBW45 TaxID=1192197 RepID=I8TMG6_9FIRM|nr:C4-dicarboxylate transporter DcuC [Pelosinus fermentans]AJQ25551.1 anaerobic c4-dicarboxylate antiporter, DcuC family [Pelosinus fermentans JBW45]
MALLFTLIVTIIVGYLVFKNYKAQTVLLLGGIVLMAGAIVLGTGQILPAKSSTGLPWFDIYEFIKNTFSSTTASLGLMIMAVAGFARYMEEIGASKVLVKLAVKPLSKIHAPYLVLSATYILGQILALFIPSASGLGVLLMVTVYPILISLGVSKLSAVAAIGTTQSLDIGPASGNSVLSAKNAGIDIATYFTDYQIPVGICIVVVVAVLHYLVQQWFDKKSGHIVEKSELLLADVSKDAYPPLIYAILPIIPLGLILTFSKIGITTIKMDVVTAMLISISISMLFEYIRYRDAKKIFSSIQVFFDGMGVQFATVITLIVAGQAFAEGLIKIGAIDTLILFAQSSGLGGTAMVVVMTAIIAGSAILMGSGNAPFFAFAALAPTVAAKMSLNAVQMLLPMQFAASIARSVSPITAVIVAVSGIAKVSPFDVVKRTAIPMAGAMIVNLIATFLLVK